MDKIISYGLFKVTLVSEKMPCRSCVFKEGVGKGKPAVFCVSKIAFGEYGKQIGIKRDYYCAEHLPKEG
jgi:hypothetical protein